MPDAELDLDARDGEGSEPTAAVLRSAMERVEQVVENSDELERRYGYREKTALGRRRVHADSLERCHGLAVAPPWTIGREASDKSPSNVQQKHGGGLFYTGLRARAVLRREMPVGKDARQLVEELGRAFPASGGDARASR